MHFKIKITNKMINLTIKIVKIPIINNMVMFINDL
jgi:hypothetical protein